MTPQTISFTWTGETMEPRHIKAADRAFVIGETYALAVHEDRSSATHRHYFALINEAWQSLPEHMADRFPTADHLRKWCLIRAGYRDERSVVCASKAEAQRVKVFVRPIDDYAVVVASEAVVTVYTAKSQSMRAMGRADFQASKQAVLDIIAGIIDVSPATLAKQSEQPA